MNINGHEVERSDGAQVLIDGEQSGYWATGTYHPDEYEKWAQDYDKQARNARLAAEFRRRELAEQEQAAKDAELNRRVEVARNAWYGGRTPTLYADSRWLDVLRALDADAAERGEA